MVCAGSNGSRRLELLRRLAIHRCRRGDPRLVLALPGWTESAGVDAERAEAKRLRLPVRFYDPIEDGYRWNWIGEETAREAVA